MIAFTLCSNNYLPMARVWGESVLRHNPGSSVVIGLVDLPDSRIDYRSFGPIEVLPVADIGIPNFTEMVLRYSIVELNTAVKPFYFRYLFQRHSGTDVKICYFDPDIKIYTTLSVVEQALETASILLTPHVLSPVPLDGGPFGEHLFLNHGLYNLGFCGMRAGRAAEQALVWWADRLAEQCKDDVENGLFVDQLWMNLVPIFFDGVQISRDPGLNVAYWNLHERRLRLEDGIWFINGQRPLVFFHFSSFVFGDPESLGKHSTRYRMADWPEMRPLFDEYRSDLLGFDFSRYKAMPCVYEEQRKEWLARQKREYYKRHPSRRLVANFKAVVPKSVRSFIRSS
jgi:hypothetical protein